MARHVAQCISHRAPSGSAESEIKMRLAQLHHSMMREPQEAHITYAWYTEEGDHCFRKDFTDGYGMSQPKRTAYPEVYIHLALDKMREEIHVTGRAAFLNSSSHGDRSPAA